MSASAKKDGPCEREDSPSPAVAAKLEELRKCCEKLAPSSSVLEEPALIKLVISDDEE